MEENNYKKHLEKELKILRSSLKEGTELTIEPFLPAINQIIDIFSDQGHSGCSASYSSSYLFEVIKNVLSFSPLSPIAGEDNEWDYVEGATDLPKLYQNKRLSSVLKDGKSKPYYLDAIVWKVEEEYDTFTGKVEEISSHQFIKLPFTPKTFYIDVVKVYSENIPENTCDYYEENGKFYKYKIKDRNQIKKVFEYYDTEF